MHSYSPTKNYSVADTFMEAGIDTTEFRKTHGEASTTCPQCSANRKPEHQKLRCLNVNLTQGKWKCHHCDYAGRLADESDSIAAQRRAEQAQKTYKLPELGNSTQLSDGLVRWFADERGLTQDTLRHFGLREEKGWMRFPYFIGEECVNIKYRKVGDKKFQLGKDAKLVLFNLNAIQSCREAIIVEGEIDAMTWHQAGFPNVVSVPNGTSLSAKEKQEFERTGQFNDAHPLNLEYLDNCWDDVQHIETWYIAGDTDPAGMKLRRELIRRFGAEKCKIVTYQGYKDANELATKSSILDLEGCLLSATSVPLDGIHTVDTEMHDILHLMRNGLPMGASLGIDEFDKYFSLLPAQLTIWTGVPGDGKCLALDTPVMMYDGTIKKVQDIVAGDQLMGPDSTPRNVLSLARGREQMWWVRQNSGDDYRVNESHILTLRKSKRRRSPEPELIDISVREILQKPKTFLGTWKGFKAAGVNFPPRPAPRVEPYYLGVWLGDGSTACATRVTNKDQEIADYLRDYATRLGLDLTFVTNTNGCPTYAISAGRGGLPDRNSLLHQMRSYGLEGNKHVPLDFLLGSRETRLEVLAGLLDSDGTYNGRMYDITLKIKELAETTQRLAQGLGFYSSIRSKQATMRRKDGTLYTCEVWRVHISGNDMSVIPCRIARKMATPAAAGRFCDALSTGIRLEKDIVDDYYGFTIDGDRRFLLGDLTVTHNTTIAYFLMMLTSLLYGWKWAVYSPENYPVAELFIYLAQLIVGREARGYGNTPEGEAEFLSALRDHIRDHFFVINSNRIHTHPELRKAFHALVQRYGITAYCVDPFNDVSRPKGMDDTEYVTTELSEYRRLNREDGTTGWILAHPRTLRKVEGTNYYPIAQASDILGGQAWWSRCDNLICVHRERRDSTDFTTHLHVHKFKKHRQGGGQTDPLDPISLTYEPGSGRFHGTFSSSTIAQFKDSVAPRVTVSEQRALDGRYQNLPLEPKPGTVNTSMGSDFDDYPDLPPSAPAYDREDDNYQDDDDPPF